MFSKTFSFLVCASLIHSAAAWFRISCPTSPLVTERVDPIVFPGQSPSGHVHTVHGASNFAPNNTFESLRKSSCTNCMVKQDLSNYWFPKLYFQDPKTKKFEAVPNGGLLVYYQNRGNSDKSNGGPGLKAFPPGFRMISGNSAARSKKYPEGEGSQGELREKAVQYACLRYTSENDGYRGYGFPTTDCEAGFQARVHMPACWDGKNLDSPDHFSHVAYLSRIDNGKCPSTHPVGFLKLLYEINWNIHSFSSRWNPAVDKWPFVYSTGDPTGFSAHGDFQNGWDIQVLQNAIDKCDNPNDKTGSGVTEACPFFAMQTDTDAHNCKINPIVSEPTEGVLDKLPGCNPLRAGPADAPVYSDKDCPF